MPTIVHPINVSTYLPPGSESQAHPPTLPQYLAESTSLCIHALLGIHGVISKIINGQHYLARKTLGRYMYLPICPKETRLK